jgi:phenylalanyl-tRNA synthetase beta chain
MKLSVAWLKSLAPVAWDADEIARRLTLAGLEIEGIERRRVAAEGVVVGRVLEARPHPNADKLRVARVDSGQGVLEIVCGAPNCRAGLTVALAMIGARLPGGLEIKRAKIRGEESFGMLCSGTELGLSSDSDGILELDASLLVGQSLQAALNLDDDVLDASPTANRGDLLSHLGVARELAALAGVALQRPETLWPTDHGTTSAVVPVRVSSPERCGRYLGRVIEGLRVAPSPLWMRRRLESLGVRPINGLVDVTNYVLMEYGQPLHAFDLDALHGPSIEVRCARPGERMSTLDGVERTLDVVDLLVCDANGPVALAGIMGGLDSEIRETTTRVFLESAHFEPTGVRATSRRLGLRSESSQRFERGVDPEVTREASDRAVRLFLEVAGGPETVVSSVASEVRAPSAPRTFVDFAPSHTRRRLGASIDPGTQRVALGRFGFEVEVGGEASDDPWKVGVPTWRSDVAESADLVEEVARFVGFDVIPTPPARISSNTRVGHVREARLRAVRGLLLDAGFDQALNYPFLSAELLGRFDTAETWRLVNPLSDDLRVLRTTLIARLVANAAHNTRHDQADVRLFETGRVFLDATGQPHAAEPREVERLGLVLCGHVPAHWSVARRAVDFYDLKGVVEGLLQQSGVDGVTWSTQDLPGYLHPGASASLRDARGVSLGVLGELHPSLVRHFGFEQAPIVAELDLAPMLDGEDTPRRFVDFARFPVVRRDLALLVERGLSAGRVLEEIRAARIDYFDDATVFDVYEGEGVSEGKKSLGLTLTWRASDRTLTDDEVTRAQARVVECLGAAFGATLR